MKYPQRRVRPPTWDALADSYDRFATAAAVLLLRKLPKRQLETELAALLEAEALPMLRRCGRRPGKVDGD